MEGDEYDTEYLSGAQRTQIIRKDEESLRDEKNSLTNTNKTDSNDNTQENKPKEVKDKKLSKETTSKSSKCCLLL